MEKLKVFISSKMAELRDVREVVARALDDRGIDAWVYEAHAGARPEDVVETSLSEVEAADIYVGLFWQKYGEVTVQEYRHARALDKPCFVYIRDKDIQREKALEDFLESEVYDLEKGVTYDYFDSAIELGEQVADNIMAWLVRRHLEMTAEIQAARVSQDEIARLQAMERHQPFEPEMVLIPAGEFLMGSDPNIDKDALDNEQPQHTLYLPGYYLAKTPVINAQYAAFVQATGHRQPEYWEGGKPPSGKEEHPVVYITWHGAIAYCNWLSEVTGKPYCLPSEAEWEKGARGSDGRIYPWGNRWDAKRCNSEESGKGDTTPVGGYPQATSPYGLLDMAGNVWEWTRSVYRDYPYDPEDGREDLEAGGPRVLRGGPLSYDERVVRCAYRPRDFPLDFFKYLGFRVMTPGSPLGSEVSGGLGICASQG